MLLILSSTLLHPHSCIHTHSQIYSNSLFSFLLVWSRPVTHFLLPLPTSPRRYYKKKAYRQISSRSSRKKRPQITGLGDTFFCTHSAPLFFFYVYYPLRLHLTTSRFKGMSEDWERQITSSVDFFSTPMHSTPPASLYLSFLSFSPGYDRSCGWSFVTGNCIFPSIFCHFHAPQTAFQPSLPSFLTSPGSHLSYVSLCCFKDIRCMWSFKTANYIFSFFFIYLFFLPPMYSTPPSTFRLFLTYLPLLHLSYVSPL